MSYGGHNRCHLVLRALLSSIGASYFCVFTFCWLTMSEIVSYTQRPRSPASHLASTLTEDELADAAFLIRMLTIVQTGRGNCIWKYTMGSPFAIITPTTLVVVSEKPDSKVQFAMGIEVASTDLNYRSVMGVCCCVECGCQWPKLYGLGIAWATDDRRSLAWWSKSGKLRCTCCAVDSYSAKPRSFVVVPPC